MPVEIKESSPSRFKATVKKFLLSRAFYSVTEFMNCQISGGLLYPWRLSYGICMFGFHFQEKHTLRYYVLLLWYTSVKPVIFYFVHILVGRLVVLYLLLTFTRFILLCFILCIHVCKSFVLVARINYLLNRVSLEINTTDWANIVNEFFFFR